MGVCMSNNSIIEDKHLNQILEHFQVPMPYADEYKLFQTIPQLEIIQHNQMSEFAILYTKISNVQNKMGEEIGIWQEKFNQHNHPNLLLIHSISIQSENRLFIPYVTITLLIDYPIEPLSRHKKVVGKLSFNEDEIWELLDCVVAAFAFQQEASIYPSSFEMDDIVVVQTPFGKKVYKIIDRCFKPQKISAFSEFISQFDDKNALGELKKWAWLSPLQIQAIPKRDKYLKHNRYKTDVFILGVMCLQLIYTKRPEIYDWKKWTIDEFVFRKSLDGLVQKGISVKLLRLLEKMLTINQDYRSDFLQLNQEISQQFQDLGKQRLLDQYTPDQFLIIPSKPKEILQPQIFGSNNLTQAASKTKMEHIRFQQNDQKQNDFSILSHQSKNKILQPLENTMQVVQGTLKYSNGNYYVGQVCNRRRHGNGIFYDEKHQKLIEGTWTYDVPEGEVSIYNKPSEMKDPTHLNLARLDWIQYKGQVRQGLRSGQGAIFFADGSKFIGQFAENKAHGKGLYEYPNKKQIIGIWQYDLFSS